MNTLIGINVLAVSVTFATFAWGQAIDLTDVVLTSRDADCASYEGRYTARITDVETGRELTGSLQISATDDSCEFRTNQVPNHDVGEGARWREVIEPNETALAVSRQPQKAQTPSPLNMGANAILLNGIKWEAYPAACFGVGREPLGREKIGCMQDQLGNPWRYNIGSPLNEFGFDIYFAHLQPGGLYHYHSTPIALYRADCAAGPSPVIGFASDGFPVHGPCVQTADGSARKMKSSYVLREGVRQPVPGYDQTPYKVGDVESDSYDGQFIGDYQFVEGAGDLDICNGAEVDGKYGYYLTESYPYVLACVSGTPSRRFR